MSNEAVSPDLIAAVRAHALENYQTDGWDFVVEAWGDTDIADAVGRATTPEGAIAAVLETTRLLDEQRSEVRAEIF